MATIFKSTLPDVAIPNGNLAKLVMARWAEFGTRTAITCGATGRSYSYAQLRGMIVKFAAGLASRGLGRGSVVAIMAPNIPEYAVAFHGALFAGITVTTLNSLYTAREIVHQLHDSGASVMITVGAFLPQVQEALASVPEVKEIIVIGDAPDGTTSFAAVMQNNEPIPDVAIDGNTDIAVLPYSSGTTGLAKGVRLSHSNVAGNIAQTFQLLSVKESDVLLGVLPFFHIYGQVAILNMGIMHGAHIVTLPRFDFAQFLTTMQQHKITVAFLAPPIMVGIAKHPAVDTVNLEALHTILSGAAPLSAELAVAVRARVSARAGHEVAVLQGYGMTELSPVSHVTPYTPIKDGSVGVLVPNTEMRLVSTETGLPVGPNERGEIQIRGPQVMHGYLNNDEATKITILEDGFLCTGDIGYVDDDGFLFVVDRVKELIKYKGYQVPPAELEAVLLTHPKIKDAGCVPVPDDEAGELPKAFVVRTSDDLTEEEVMQYVEERVAPYKKIRIVQFIAEIPKSGSGKILRRVLREMK